MSRYLVELGLTGQDDYVICYNGALVQQVADQRIIRSQLLTGSDASAIAALADELGVNVHGFGEPGAHQPQGQPLHRARIPPHRHAHQAAGLRHPARRRADPQGDDDRPRAAALPAIAKLPAELYQRYTVVRSAPTSSSS